MQAEARVRAQMEEQNGSNQQPATTRNEDSSASQSDAPVQPVGAPQSPVDTPPERSVNNSLDLTGAQLEQSVISQHRSADSQTAQQPDETPADSGEEENDMLDTIRALNDLTNSPAGCRSTASRTNRKALKRNLPANSENSLAKNRGKRAKTVNSLRIAP